MEITSKMVAAALASTTLGEGPRTLERALNFSGADTARRVVRAALAAALAAAEPEAKTPAELLLDCLAQALGLDVFNYQLADAAGMVEYLRQTNQELAEENLRYRLLESNWHSSLETNQVLRERLVAASQVLEGYEQWEANVIGADAAWHTPAAHPWQTEALYQEWMSLQQARNQVVRPGVPTAGKEAARA